MSDKDFYTLWAAALAEDDRDMYVAEWSTSSIWGMLESMTDDDLIRTAEYCGNLWDVAHMTVKDICKAASLTQAAFAQRFCIPKRTVEDWCRGVRTPPDYVKLMIGKLLGLV